MSVNLTRSVCGIVIDGNQIDTTPELLVKNPEKAGIVAENRGISENAVRPNRTYKKDTEGHGVARKLYATKGERASKTVHNGFSVCLEEKKRKEEQIKDIRDFTKQRKKTINDKVDKDREQRKKNWERQQENKKKGQVYQEVTNLKNIKKWSKKARQQLVRMPKDMFEKYLLKHKAANTKTGTTSSKYVQ